MVCDVSALGDTLRERRQSLGISLEQAEAATRIRAKLLALIEQGDYERLPNPGYVRGYISSYARFLELDSVPLLNMYKAEGGGAHATSLNLPQAGPRVVAPTGMQHAFPWRAGLAIAAAVALLALLIWGIGRAFRGPEPTAPVPNTPATSSTTSTTTATTETPAADAAENPAVLKPFTLTVKVSSQGASWLRITVDGQRAYEGVLTAGQSKEYKVTESATVRIGKPEWVRVEKDGNKVPIKRQGDISIAVAEADSAQ